MRRPVLTRAEVRQVDRLAIDQYRIPGMVLMENAGRGCVDVLCRLKIKGPVVICCGRGNNAGDGLVMARHLDLRGYEVRVLFWSDPRDLTGDAALNFHIACAADLPVYYQDDPQQMDDFLADQLFRADWVVDAMLGTGARGAPRAPLDRVIRQLNDHSARKLAVDLPSGLDCDTGEIAEPCFRADHTCTFVAAKPGLLVDRAQRWVGQLHVLDIGAPRHLLEEFGL